MVTFPARPLVATMLFAPGQRLGAYEIDCAIGAGGMGEVYRARDLRLDRLVAIKVLAPHLAAEPEFRARFDRETRAIAALNHPHICTLYHVGHDSGVDFIVMEYLEGRTLAERLSDGPLTIDDALTVAVEVADALSQAHALGIVHRDLKPANIMLTSAGVKILDFGLATRPHSPRGVAGTTAPTAPAAALTKDDVLLGTLGYMAPEQAMGKSAGPSADVFSFGAILYEMVTGRGAFARGTAAETLAATILDEPEPIRPVHDLAKMSAIQRIVERSLAKEAARRFSDMADVMAELQGVVAIAGSRVTPGHEARSERRIITALIVEIVRVRPSADLGPELLAHALDRAFVGVQEVIETHGGFVERTAGDALRAIFGAPIAHADDPQRAIRSADACARWFDTQQRTSISLAVRVGIETGHALVQSRGADRTQSMTVGECVTVAARLQQLAAPGQVIVGPMCQRANSETAEFADLPPCDVGGMGTLPAWRLVAVKSVPQRPVLPLVGRETELDVLRAAFRRAQSRRSALAVVFGPPGQGKSRLLDEFVSLVGDDALVRRASCRRASERGARNPLAGLLTSSEIDLTPGHLAAEISLLLPDPIEGRRVFEAVAHSAGLSRSQELSALSKGEALDEVTNGWRRYVLALAKEKPVVFAIDDLHWADAEIVQLLDRLTFGSDLPILVAGTARGELQPSSAFRAGGNRFFLVLDTLDDADARRLASLAGAVELSGVERAEGNPLFITELARARAFGSRDVPVTVEGAIGARLDELPYRDRDLLQRTAIVGDAFTLQDASLVSRRDAGDVSQALARLTDLQFLDPAPGGLRFHHALIRDVCYGRLTATERMHLHAAYAREAVPPDHVEALAHHLWQALGPDDADWVWEGDPEWPDLRAAAYSAQLAAARDYAARFAFSRAIDTCARAFRFAATGVERARVEQMLGDLQAASGDADAGAAHYLRARDLYRESGTPPPPDLYASFLEPPVYTSGMFRHPPDEALVRAMLHEGEEAARASEDVTSRARVVGLRAYRSHDVAELGEALRLSEGASNPASLQPLLVHAAILQSRAGEFAEAQRTYERLDHVAAAAGFADRPHEFRGILALHIGNLDEAGRAADAFLAASAPRGPHIRTHAFRERSHVLLARGEWRALAELAAETDRVVAAYPDTAFCYAVTTVRAFALVGLAVEGMTEEAHALLRQVEAPLQAEPLERESLLVLVYGVLGRRDAVSRLGAEVRARGSAPFWFFQRTYAVTLVMLEAWSDLEEVLPSLDEVAKGSAYLVALLLAIREEIAAARGGDRPAHAALRQLGYIGWSRLLAHRSCYVTVPPRL